jgi:hypothetical protein
MSPVVKLMIGGWLATFAMIGFCALAESGKLVKLEIRLVSWLESLLEIMNARIARIVPGESLQSDREDVA